MDIDVGSVAELLMPDEGLERDGSIHRAEEKRFGE